MEFNQTHLLEITMKTFVSPPPMALQISNYLLTIANPCSQQVVFTHTSSITSIKDHLGPFS